MNACIDWFARNPVAANLLMAFLVVSGLFASTTVKQEVWPEFSLDQVSIEVPYLGAAPEEVETAVAVRIEEAIQGIDGIEKITSRSYEGVGSISVELDLGADPRKVVDDIKTNVDAITTFPEEAEKPVIRELTTRQQVIDVAISGTTDEFTLKRVAERVRDELSALPEITQVEIVGAPPYEIAIEVSEVALRRHGLQFDDVAEAVRRSSLDLPGGSVRAESGEILLRTIGQVYRGHEYEELTVLTRSDGTRLKLSDVATVVDGFAETDESARFDMAPAVLVSVFRTGDQNAVELASAVHEYVAETQVRLPDGIKLTAWQDQARMLDSRLTLLIESGLTGFVLVFVSLALFLDLRLAFWTSLGIPISFLAAIWLMPTLDVSINVLSLFAFILVLGIVVDDAIVVGENIHRHQEQHGKGLKGAISGAKEISTPIIFAVLTSVAAFLPMMFVPGSSGKIFAVFPLIVIPCLLFSLVESLVILPAHLSHLPRYHARGPWRRFQSLFTGSLAWVIVRVYQPFLDVAVRWRYLTASAGVAVLILTIGTIVGGYTNFVFFPSIEADFMSASVTMPQGSTVEATSQAISRLESGAERLRSELQAEIGLDVFEHSFAVVGSASMSGGRGPMGSASSQASANVGEVMVELIPSDERPLTSEALGNRWRDLVGPIPEAVDVSFNATIMSAGEDINVQLMGQDVEMLREAAAVIRLRLSEFAGVYEISDSFRSGKRELRFGIKPAAETLGLTLQELGRQVRQGFYGEEAQRIQRGRDDIRVMVRYPESERRSLGDLQDMRIRIAGGEVPFRDVATVEEGRGFSSITRVDRNRVVNVTAEVDASVASSDVVISALRETILPNVLAAYPGVLYSFEGVQSEQADSLGGLFRGFGVALLLIFGLLAVPLRSYIQPLIIMSAIPFGLVGAIWGHVIMGLDVTLFSMFGLVALTGVVVNDSLVMVDFINRRQQQAVDMESAVREAGVARFRPILLTSVTTFVGLAPLMLNKSLEAAFLVPMAVSLAFGVLFATVITLGLVPVVYLILDDMVRGFRRIAAGRSNPVSDELSSPSFNSLHN